MNKLIQQSKQHQQFNETPDKVLMNRNSSPKHESETKVSSKEERLSQRFDEVKYTKFQMAPPNVHHPPRQASMGNKDVFSEMLDEMKKTNKKLENLEGINQKFDAMTIAIEGTNHKVDAMTIAIEGTNHKVEAMTIAIQDLVYQQYNLV
jgi:hypothetical protein